MEILGELWNSTQNNPHVSYVMLCDDSEYVVLDEGEEYEWFDGKTGVKQGDVMYGFIFLVVVEWIMSGSMVKLELNKEM